MIPSIGPLTEKDYRSRACVCKCLFTLFHDVKLTGASYTFAIGIASAAIYSVLDAIEEDTELTLDDLNAGTGYMVLIQYPQRKHGLKTI